MRLQNYINEANNYIVYYDGTVIDVKGFKKKEFDDDEKDALGREIYEKIEKFIKQMRKSKKLKGKKIDTITIQLK